MSVWRWGMLAALAVLGLGVLAWAGSGLMQGERPSGIAILGDAAPALHDAMGTTQALPVGSAAVTVVSVFDWDRLRYISDMAAVCGPDCAGEVGLVRAVRLLPGGSRKVIFVNHDAWPGLADQTAPEDPPRDYGCLAATLSGEAMRLTAAEVPACARSVPAAAGTRWVLPFGLGAL